jgi:hypothetical protein
MKRNLVLFSCFLLLSAGSALAQTAPTYQVTTTPTFVINDGRSESMGSVRLTVTAASANTFPSTIQYNFQNLACDLTTGPNPLAIAATTTTDFAAPGPQLVIGASTGTAITGAMITDVSNTAGGCTVSVTVPGASTAVLGDFLELQGIRGRVDISPGAAVGTSLVAVLSSTPSTSSLFTVPNQGVVGISAKPWEFVKVTQLGSILFCPSTPVNPIFSFKEDFNGSFVQYVDASGDLGGGYTLPADHRPLFGAINNTQLHIVISDLPSGTTLAWDALATNTGGGVGRWSLVSQSTTGDDAVYEYSTTSQNTSDITLESYTIGATLSIGTNPKAGTATIQAQLYPPLNATDTSSPTQSPYTAGTVKSPRFADPLQPSPGATFLTVAPCTTNLLFPWMAFIPSASYDTGFAIANTTTDPYGTTAQHGTCSLNFYPTDDTTLGGTPAAQPAIQVMTPDIATGATYANNLSGIPAISGADFTGYMIAVCNFQYGHGFGYITNTFGSPTALAQGYVALVIPDPVINNGRLPDSQDKGVLQSGEGLGQ